MKLPRSSLHIERLWKGFFMDPSQWLDKRAIKKNPRSPDFKHKITLQSLWLDGWHNPSWVKDMLQKMELAVPGIHKATSQELPQNSSWEMLGLEEALVILERMPQPPSAECFTCILNKCRKQKDLAYAQRLHAYMCKTGLEVQRSLGNYLVPMLVDVGSMHDAQKVFDRLVYRNEYSWTSLITGYVECGESHHALHLYQKMQKDCVQPSGYTFVAVLKACARLNDAERGQELHAELARKGLESDPFVVNTLVSMYAKCGLLAKAQEVFNKLPVRDVVSWNTLITAYAEHGLGEEALNFFEQILLEGIPPDALTFVSSLKACSCIKAIEKGQEIHSELAKMGLLESDPLVGNALVDMYGKCGSVAKAHEVFDELAVHDAVSWTALIAGYAEHGLGEEALNCFEHMQLEGVSPDALTFACSLKACGSIGAVEKGQEIHHDIARKGLLEGDSFLGNALLDMYAKCGLLEKAHEVFDKLSVRDTVSWKALIAGYARHGHGQEVLNCFKQMQLEGHPLHAAAFVCCLKACGSTGDIGKGREVHTEIAETGLETDPFVGSSLVDMYAKCGLLAKAREVFDKLPVHDVLLWNVLIAGYAEHGLGEEAMNCLERMQLEGVSPDAFTFVCSLKACASIGAIDKGREIHADIARQGLLERDPFVGNALVDMYAKGGLLSEAQEVFDKLSVQDAVSWNALIVGYAKYGLGEEALNCFQQMQLEGLSPNAITFVCTLKACANIGAIDRGQEIHSEITRKGLESDVFVGSTLVNMYAKHGLLTKAWEVFDKLPVQDVVSWTALIAGYVEQGLGEEALNCFERMQVEGVSPDDLTFVWSLKACGSIGAVDRGQEIHAQIAGKAWFERHPFVGNALVDMYAKCGSLAKAQEVFDNLPVRNEISWNTLLVGYAHLGKSGNVFHLIERMKGEGIKPDEVTFLSILTVCSHAGLVGRGQKYFEAMTKEFGITPTIEHHTCVVDLLGRAGQLDEAVAVMKKMPFHPNVSVCHALLGACRKWGNVELGRQAFEHVMQLDAKDTASYVIMSNIHADLHAVG